MNMNRLVEDFHTTFKKVEDLHGSLNTDLISVMRKPQENQTLTGRSKLLTGRSKLSKQRSKPKGIIFRENLPVTQNNSGADLTFNFNYQSEDINKGTHFLYKDTSISPLWDAVSQGRFFLTPLLLYPKLN